MADENKDLYYLNELSDYKVAEDYPDVRGWEVKDADNRTIGKVDNLLVSKSAKRVVYLDIEVDEAVIEAGHDTYGESAANGVHEYLNKEGEDHLIIPIGMVNLNESEELVHSNQVTHETFAKTSRFNKGEVINRDYELLVYGSYLPKSTDTRVEDDKNFYDRKEFKKS